MGGIAAKLGKPFMPWQQHVMDVALEINPDTGRLAYREVRLGVPRQSGKTTLTLSRVIWRAEASHHLGGRQRMLYAAQTGKDAAAKWQEDFVEDLAAARVMKGRYRVFLPSGRQRIRFRSASTFAPIATMKTSGHGNTLDDGTLDEAFAQVDDRVEEAWRPAMITRPQAQFWIVSTAGDLKSIYLREKVKTGRDIVDTGRASRVAYFEWGAPHDADPESPETWAACMPALGLTIAVEDIRHEFDTIVGGLPAFRRAYLNQWADEFDDVEWILPRASWRACADEDSIRVGEPALAVDVSPNRSTAAVSMAAARADGLPMVMTVRAGEGADWVAGEVGAIVRRTGARCVVLDSVGPASNLRQAIEGELKGLRKRVPLKLMDSGQVCDAWSSFEDAVTTEQLRHLNQPEVNEALRGAALRKVGLRNALDRRNALADITPLVSCDHALWGLSNTPPPRVPLVATGG